MTLAHAATNEPSCLRLMFGEECVDSGVKLLARHLTLKQAVEQVKQNSLRKNSTRLGVGDTVSPTTTIVPSSSAAAAGNRRAPW